MQKVHMMDELCVLFFGSHFVVLVVDMGNAMGLVMWILYAADLGCSLEV
jgi:hypothetical protein